MSINNVYSFDVNRRESRHEVNHDMKLNEHAFDEPIFEGIVGQSAAMRCVLDLVETVAPRDSTVLLLGETGTGKELIARAIHQLSSRRERPMVKLNCAAIPSGLLESELFGHERGAFTGALSTKAGRLELADEGTLFLDEVGDIPLELQPKLLRALQEREFERLGSTQTKRVDARLVAATNCDLTAMIADKTFRSDLYYRLNVFPIRIPSLRERSDDIPFLVQHFTTKYARRMGKEIQTIHGASLQQLIRWHWPGNIRELENLIERSVILTQGTTLQVASPEPLVRPSDSVKETIGFSEENEGALRILGRLMDLANIRSGDAGPSAENNSTMLSGTAAARRAEAIIEERNAIIQILRDTNGRVGGPNGAAARLGLKRTTLIEKMKRLGIEPRRVLGV